MTGAGPAAKLADRPATLASYSASAPLLLVTAFSPAHRGGGAVILRSLLGGSGRSDVVWASLAPREGPATGRVAHRVGGRSPWLLPADRLARAIDGVAERHAARAVWIIAHGPILPSIAPLASRYGRAVHLTVHDDPAWAVVFRTRRELALTPRVHMSLGRAVAASKSVDVISAGMRAEFARRFGVDSIVVNRIVEGPIAVNDVYTRSASLSVGILGSVYAPRQLEALLRAVAGAAGRAGVRGRVLVIGGHDPRLVARASAHPDVDVTFTGHLPEAEGIDALRRVFALYLGYPFGPRARVLRRTSFPTKLATYLPAARPLLVHTPYDSTLTPLLASAPYTIPWLDDDARMGASQLLRAWNDAALHVSQHVPAEAVRVRYFGPENRTRLFDALDRLPHA